MLVYTFNKYDPNSTMALILYLEDFLNWLHFHLSQSKTIFFIVVWSNYFIALKC